MSKLPDRWPLFLLIVLLLPMCFIGLRDTHDWGDDFAQYLAQARDLSGAHAIDARDGVLNYDGYGPAPKGIGFSVLLAPIWAASGHSVFSHLVLMSVVAFLLCLALYVYLRHDFGWLAAMLASLLFAYDRHVLHAKSQIMPDLLLTLLVLVCLMLLRRNDGWRWWLLPVLLGFAILVKSAGWMLYIAVAISLVLAWRKRSTDPPMRRTHVAWMMMIPLAMALIVPLALSRSAGSSALWYANVFFDGSVFATIGTNVPIYAASLWHFFEQELPMWMNHLMVPLLLLTIIAGVVVRIRRGADAGDGFVALWMLMLLCYPYTNASDRFLLPMLPFVLRYLLDGLRWIAARVRLPERPVIATALVGFLLLHVITVRLIVEQDERLVTGPYGSDAQKAFAEVKEGTPTNALIGSARPWAVHLFTDRTTVWMPTPGNGNRPVAHAHDPIPDFMLLATDPRHKGMYDLLLLEEVMNDSAHWTTSWRNGSFELFARRP